MTQQQHGKFKLFIGQSTPESPIGALGGQVAEFVASTGVAAKSIGTEYLESKKSLVVSLGYRDDEPGYPVQLHCVKLAGLSGTDDLSQLESQMSAAAAQFTGIICHELFITDDGRFYMVFMVQTS
jgi:hypothetical protein